MSNFTLNMAILVLWGVAGNYMDKNRIITAPENWALYGAAIVFMLDRLPKIG